jgi:hypothetical protein
MATSIHLDSKKIYTENPLRQTAFTSTTFTTNKNIKHPFARQTFCNNPILHQKASATIFLQQTQNSQKLTRTKESMTTILVSNVKTGSPKTHLQRPNEFDGFSALPKRASH